MTKTEIPRSRELARRAKRKQDKKAVNHTHLGVDGFQEWYMKAYQRFSISLRSKYAENQYDND